jgi:TetR/AcrR family transcriptional regulator
MFSKFANLESERRDAIINAALKEFAVKGYVDASTNIIAKDSGVKKALMFHYINSKKELFLFLFDYCNQILKKEYHDLIKFNERDIFERFRQVYLLKIEVIHRYPWIFEFIKVALLTESNEVKLELDERKKGAESSGYELMFANIDESKFREGLNIEKCKKLIFWAIWGYSMNLLEELRSLEIMELDLEKLRVEFDSYLDELRKSFYK